MQSGCATIISGQHQNIQVLSEPIGANACAYIGSDLRNIIKTEQTQCVVTPGTFKLRRDDNQIIQIDKEGFHKEYINLTSGWNGVILGNVVVGGIVGGAIDIGTGAAYQLYPNKINVNLRPLSEASFIPSALKD